MVRYMPINAPLAVENGKLTKRQRTKWVVRWPIWRSYEPMARQLMKHLCQINTQASTELMGYYQPTFDSALCCGTKASFKIQSDDGRHIIWLCEEHHDLWAEEWENTPSDKYKYKAYAVELEEEPPAPLTTEELDFFRFYEGQFAVSEENK